jgi:hypothetical protein
MGLNALLNRSSWIRLAAMLSSVVAFFVVSPLVQARSSTQSEVSYRASRPGLNFSLTVKGHRVSEIRMHFTQHCSDGSVQHPAIRRPGFNRKIEGSGKFHWSITQNGNGFTHREGGGGIVHWSRVAGRFRVIDVLTFGGKLVRCWTGRSLQDPSVSFVAQRQ